MSMRSISILLVLLLMFAAPIHAEDEASTPKGAQDVEDLSLTALRAPWLVRSPSIYSPIDNEAQPDQHGVHPLGHMSEPIEWLVFSEPDHDRYLLPPDAIIEAMDNWERGLFSRDSVEIAYSGGNTIRVVGPERVRRKARAAFEWIRGGLAPSVHVSATLRQTAPEDQLLAMSSGHVHAGRWTRVYLQRELTPFGSHASIEIAQKSTATLPEPVWLPQGEELYMRLHPGESRSIVELWSGELRHVESREIDMSGVRNVPEASAIDRLDLPTTRIQRGYAAVVLPTGKATRHTLHFQEGARTSTLELGFGPPPAAHPIAEREGQAPLAVLRIGAAMAPFEWNSRPGNVDLWVERMLKSAARQGFNSDEFSIHLMGGGSALLVEGPSDLVSFVRSTIIESERGLRTERVAVRVLSLPQAVFLAQGGLQKVRPGAALDANFVKSVLPGGAVTVRGAGLSTVRDMRAALRIGLGVSGLREFESEVAQEAGGIVAQTCMGFAGLIGYVRVQREANELELAFRGHLRHADAGAGKLQMVVRPPIPMSTGERRYETENEVVWRRKSYPIMGVSGAAIDASVRLPADGAEVPLAVIVQGTDVHLVLARIDER